MDRLAENIRTTPTNRAESIDFTRSQASRAERTDAVEARADQRVDDRKRLERSSEKSERFSQHLEEQHASQEPRTPVQERAETRETRDTEPHREEPKDETAAQSERTNATAAQSTGEAAHEQAAPASEARVLEIPAPAPVSQPAAPAVALPSAANAALPTSVPALPEILPAIAAAPTLAVEKTKLEVESSTTKLQAPRADNGPNQIHSPSPSRETPVEPTKAEAPREAPAARSAHEVERAADILRQIRVQLTPELSEARIQLQPIELGRVSIHITLEEGRMKTVVRAEKSETLQAIQTHLPELRASLRQHGIDARDFQLMLGFENRERRDGDRSPAPSSSRTADAEIPAVERSPSLHAAVAQTGVDFYA